MSSAASSYINGGRDHIIGFRVSSDENTIFNLIYIQEVDLEAMIEANAICRRTVIFY